MNEHYIVTLDGGRLRIYAQHRGTANPARLEVVEAMDFPDSLETRGVSHVQHSRLFAGGVSINENVAANNEGAQRNVRTLATEINMFLQNRPAATWDFAAPISIFESVIEELSSEIVHRLRRSLSKDLVNQNAEEVRAQFAAVA